MDVNLQSLENIDFSHSERAIFNILKATLQYPANPQAKGAKLANDITFFFKSPEEDDCIENILWEVWAVIIDIACCIPSGHLWQESLVQSLNSLRQRDGFIRGKSLWKDLPNLSFSVREHWSDPTKTGEELSEEFAKWESFNSFIARLTSDNFAPWLNIPIWQLRTALEEPPMQGSVMGCRLWVATEWIIQCAKIIFEEMNPQKELDESTARAFMTGSLCDNKKNPPPLSVERWNFWKKRFSDIAADADNLRLDSSITVRISDALKRMNDCANG